MENNTPLSILCDIDMIVSIDAQIAALQAQRKTIAERVKNHMAENACGELISSTGHKALLTSYTKSTLSQKLLAAEFGAQFVERFKVPGVETRFTVK